MQTSSELYFFAGKVQINSKKDLFFAKVFIAVYNPLFPNLKANMTLSHFLLHYWHYLFDFFPLAQNLGVKVALLMSGKSRHPRNLFWKVLSFSAKWHKQVQVKHYCCLLTNVSHFLVMPLKHGFHLEITAPGPQSAEDMHAQKWEGKCSYVMHGSLSFAYRVRKRRRGTPIYEKI